PLNPTAWSEERVVHLPERQRRARRAERGTLGARQADDGLSPRLGITRIDSSRAQFVLDDVDARAHNVWRYCISYHQKSVRGEVVNGCCHLSLLLVRPTPRVQWRGQHCHRPVTEPPSRKSPLSPRPPATRG